MFKKEEYALKLERFAQFIGIGYFKLYFLISILINSFVAFIMPLGIIYISKNHVLYKLFIKQLFWTTPGIFGNIFSLVFIRVIRNNYIETINLLSSYLKNSNKFHDLLLNMFSTWLHIYVIIPFVLFSILFQLYHLILNPWPWWQLWYETSPKLTLIMAILSIIGTAFTYLLYFMLAYICVFSCYILYDIGKELKNIEIDKLELLRLNSIGRISLLTSISWIITLGPSLFTLIIAPIEWWTMIQVIGFIVSSILLFFLPTYSTHQTLVKMKERALTNIKGKIWDSYSIIINSSTMLEEMEKAELRIKFLDNYEDRIIEYSTWPFDTAHLIQFISTLAITTMPIILKMILGFFNVVSV